eukprot:07834_1
MISASWGSVKYRNADLAASYSRARCDFISQRKWGTKGFLDCLVFSFFSFWKINTKIAKDNVSHSEKWCPAIRLHLGTRKYLSQVFRRCDVYLFPSNDSENVERRTHIPQTLNSMSVHTESTLEESTNGEFQDARGTSLSPGAKAQPSTWSSQGYSYSFGSEAVPPRRRRLFKSESTSSLTVFKFNFTPRLWKETVVTIDRHENREEE